MILRIFIGRGVLFCLLCLLVLFSGAICYLGCSSVPGEGLDSCVVVWFSFSCCCFGWRFRCSLGCCFGLCFCVVGGPAPGLVLAWPLQFLLVAILVVVFCI